MTTETVTPTPALHSGATMGSLVLRTLRRYPDRTAFVTATGSLSYAATADLIGRFQHVLAADVGPVDIALGEEKEGVADQECHDHRQRRGLENAKPEEKEDDQAQVCQRLQRNVRDDKDLDHRDGLVQWGAQEEHIGRMVEEGITLAGHVNRDHQPDADRHRLRSPAKAGALPALIHRKTQDQSVVDLERNYRQALEETAS